jgi:hypothetical protein
LIEHHPPQMHLAVVTREDPPLPLPRLRAQGELTEIRAAGLQIAAAPDAARTDLGSAPAGQWLVRAQRVSSEPFLSMLRAFHLDMSGGEREEGEQSLRDAEQAIDSRSNENPGDTFQVSNPSWPI